MFPPRIPSKSTTFNQESSSLVHPDDAIRGTDDDAASSRLSAVTLNYLSDPFVNLLYKPSSSASFPNAQAGPSGSGSGGRKPPLINVGTHHRTWGIDKLVDTFFEHGGRQVVSLGAGSDTRFWRLMSRQNPPNIARYIEIDFPHLTSPKAQRIARSRKLHSYLGSSPTSASSSSSPSGAGYTVSKGGAELVSPLYALLPIDLRSPISSSIPKTLSEELLPHLDPSLPTLFLAECVFCYMSPEDSSSIVRWFGDKFDNCMGVIYEMCGLGDSFGAVMKRNLATRNLSIPGSEPFPDPQSQADRFLSPSLKSGKFTSAGARTLWDIRQNIIDPEELQRISKLEFLDEIEELKLVLDHYVIAWGTKGSILEGLSW